MAARMCRTPGRRDNGDHDHDGDIDEDLHGRDHDGDEDLHDRGYGDEIVLESALPVHPAR